MGRSRRRDAQRLSVLCWRSARLFSKLLEGRSASSSPPCAPTHTRRSRAIQIQRLVDASRAHRHHTSPRTHARRREHDRRWGVGPIHLRTQLQVVPADPDVTTRGRQAPRTFAVGHARRVVSPEGLTIRVCGDAMRNRDACLQCPARRIDTQRSGLKTYLILTRRDAQTHRRRRRVRRVAATASQRVRVFPCLCSRGGQMDLSAPRVKKNSARARYGRPRPTPRAHRRLRMPIPVPPAQPLPCRRRIRQPPCIRRLRADSYLQAYMRQCVSGYESAPYCTRDVAPSTRC